MQTKLLPTIVITLAFAFFNTGCLKTHSNGTVESGTRTTLGFGLVDFQEDYSLDGDTEGFVFEEKPFESNTYSALRAVTSYSTDHNYELDGKKISFLWGLIRIKSN